MRKIKKRIVAFLMTFLMVATSSLTMPPMTVNAENITDMPNVNIVNTTPSGQEDNGIEITNPDEEGEDEEKDTEDDKESKSEDGKEDESEEGKGNESEDGK